jgi:hypothetical protein
MTLGIITLNIITVCIEYQNAACSISCIVMLNVIMLNVVPLSVVAPFQYLNTLVVIDELSIVTRLNKTY